MIDPEAKDKDPGSKRVEFMHFECRNVNYEIHPVTEAELEQVLAVYRECEDFLALGPVATASMSMVEKDLEISLAQGGIFCGIYEQDGRMIGVLDYVAANYEGKPESAYLSLLMIGASHRKLGIGQAVFETLENEIRKNPGIKIFLAGVQANNPLAIKFWQRMGFRIVSGPRRMPDQTTAFDLRKDY